jgi:hypothetical protein
MCSNSYQNITPEQGKLIRGNLGTKIIYDPNKILDILIRNRNIGFKFEFILLDFNRYVSRENYDNCTFFDRLTFIDRQGEEHFLTIVSGDAKFVEFENEFYLDLRQNVNIRYNNESLPHLIEDAGFCHYRIEFYDWTFP